MGACTARNLDEIPDIKNRTCELKEKEDLIDVTVSTLLKKPTKSVEKQLFDEVNFKKRVKYPSAWFENLLVQVNSDNVDIHDLANFTEPFKESLNNRQYAICDNAIDELVKNEKSRSTLLLLPLFMSIGYEERSNLKGWDVYKKSLINKK